MLPGKKLHHEHNNSRPVSSCSATWESGFQVANPESRAVLHLRHVVVVQRSSRGARVCSMSHCLCGWGWAAQLVAALHVFAHSAHTAVQRRATVLARTPSGGWHTLPAGITAQPLGGLWLSSTAFVLNLIRPGLGKLADEFPESVRFRKSATPRNRPTRQTGRPGMLPGVAVGATVHAACRPKGF
mgnify:CR=1 FL=1